MSTAQLKQRTAAVISLVALLSALLLGLARYESSITQPLCILLMWQRITSLIRVVILIALSLTRNRQSCHSLSCFSRDLSNLWVYCN